MKSLLFLSIFFLPIILIAQVNLPYEQIAVIAGRSSHGTGDMRGIMFTTEYAHYFKKRLGWTIGAGGSIHDGSLPLFFAARSGDTVDGSIRYTTAGAQITSHLFYSFIRSTRHELKANIGALLRYQSSSYFDQLAIYYPLATGFPTPVVVFDNRTPQRTYAVGGSAQISYNYTIRNAISLGVQLGLQTDTNGDTITQTAFAIARRF